MLWRLPKFWLLFLLFCVSFALHLLAVGETLDWRSMTSLTPIQQMILWELRLPRSVLAVAVGASLAVSGVALQALFRNPLAEPSLIGISSASALGAVLMMVLGLSLWQEVRLWQIHSAAFVFGMAGLLLIYFLANRSGRTDVAVMLLAGVALSLIAGAMTQFLMTLAEAQTLQGVTFWMFGSLANHPWSSVLLLVCVLAVVSVLFLRLARTMNAYQLGESQAFHLGFDTKRFAQWVLVLSAILVSSTVALVGLIGFVGLVVPHLMRHWVGTQHQLLLPMSALAGAVLLLLADYLAQTILYPVEIPIGVLMALVGAPFFLWMLLQQRKRLMV